MVTLQGHLYSIRDLPIDWPRGIYNIPVEVLGMGGNHENLDFVLKDPRVKTWIEEEKKMGRNQIARLKQRLRTNGDQRALLICALPIRELTKIANSKSPF